jgi:hypothetical protein
MDQDGSVFLFEFRILVRVTVATNTVPGSKSELKTTVESIACADEPMSCAFTVSYPIQLAIPRPYYS